jgi:AraC family transcriptional activator of pyochelin receptor
MKLFFTVKELYESNFVNRYFHEISYTTKQENSKSNQHFIRIKEKLSKLDSNAKIQVLKFSLEQGIDLYFFDFELNQPLNFSALDFNFPFTILLTLETKLKITSTKPQNDEDELLGHKFYEFPFTVEAEEKYGERVRLLFLNFSPTTVSEYLDMTLFAQNNEYADEFLLHDKVGMLYFHLYEESFMNQFLKSFETMPLQLKYRNDYIQFKILELVYHLFEYNRTINDANQKLLSLTAISINRIKNAKEILIGNLENPPTISQLAKQVGLNENTLKLGFKQLFSATVYGYLSNVRMEKAKYLLKIEKKNVTEVSLEVGYLSMSKFTNAFRKKYGVNPSYFKSSLKT